MCHHLVNLWSRLESVNHYSPLCTYSQILHLIPEVSAQSCVTDKEVLSHLQNEQLGASGIYQLQ